MQTKFTSPNPPTKVIPAADHRRQMIWQVWVPLAASLIIVLGFAILAILGAAVGSPQVERWGNISAVIVIVPWLVIGLVLLAIVGGSAYGVFFLLQKMPGWMLKVQLFMIQLALIIRQASDAATKPVMSVNTFSARVKALWRKVVRRSPANRSLS
ncbi:MAG: hypothetical protein EHM21_03095 [Chloroflexi bacterium]|nr:MAG: hypothetical protein EHM21_03095 [Chloroflexota bacterium]